MYRKNLKNLVEFRDSIKLTVQQSDIPLLVFDKRFGWDEDVVLEHAFDKAFSVDKSKDAWSKIGISPFTRKCLEDSKVSHELVMLPDGTIDLDTDPATVPLIAGEEKNTTAVGILNAGGFQGDVFKKLATQNFTRKGPITEPNTRARQDDLASIKYAGQHFYLTNGSTVTGDDYFISEERKRREADILMDLE